MRIAVAYDNGEIFQHFGRTEQFKIYDIEDNKVVYSEIVGSEGAGHSALADALAGNMVDVLICGGIGGGAQNALTEAGIEICSGAEGNADAAVEAYLKGELENAGVNCDHHGEGHSCGHHEESGCGCGNSDEEGGCGGCGSNEEAGGCGGCGGCGGHAPMFEGKNVGKVCRTHYRGTFNDGTQFDSSYDRGEPLEFVCGMGMMILGFDKAVADMEVGEEVDIHLMPEEAYGQPDPRYIFTVDIDNMPGSEELAVDDQVVLSGPYGQQLPVKVTAKDETTITFDANNEMAGKELNFHIELVEVED